MTTTHASDGATAPTDPITTVRVKILGALSKPPQGSDFDIGIDDEGTTVGTLLDELGYAAKHQRFIIALVNDRPVGKDHPVTAGDTVKLTLPVGGG